MKRLNFFAQCVQYSFWQETSRATRSHKHAPWPNTITSFIFWVPSQTNHLRNLYQKLQIITGTITRKNALPKKSLQTKKLWRRNVVYLRIRTYWIWPIQKFKDQIVVFPFNHVKVCTLYFIDLYNIHILYLYSVAGTKKYFLIWRFTVCHQQDWPLILDLNATFLF